MRVAVIVPIFNEGKHLEKLIKDFRQTGHPVFIVDDGSTDITTQKLKLSRLPKNIKVIRHVVNLGKGAAMKTGVQAAFTLGFDAVIFMDGDGQHASSDIKKFTNRLKTFDVVLGERKPNGNMRLHLAKLAAYLTSMLYGIKTNDLLCGFRGFTKKVYRLIRWNSVGYGVETEMVIRTGINKLKYTVVPVETLYLDVYKGFNISDGFRILVNIIYWRFTI